jgi:steroid Delta-isomerase
LEELTLELRRAVQFYENISEQSVSELVLLYGEHAYFKDPFNEVRGVAAIQGIFKAMFEQVATPRFKVTQALQDQAFQSPSATLSDAFLVWEFTFSFKRFKADQVQLVRGSSHLRFDRDGKIVFHRDYWDAAEELYEKIPILGSLMRFLRRRAQH